ncbi:hypothetical protein BGZ61DRAFT_363274 [Ilyonectria robusta]|uniref:uncharacterized protein n=1 Tax=Ilyonectria robusta TaxID=1079257 RepID=UPI001E8E2DC8|nr:uncharacterized protein BGZ61DRAFT_363274 [Ilyonectria robusta]KAH8670627.1 hypothetical protein BGZ61DRAFT_363274 [Ilyonectria robusta]
MSASKLQSKKACDACHRRKIGCDTSGPEPECDWCLHHGLLCTFDRVRGRKKIRNARARARSERSLPARISDLEEALARGIGLNLGDTSLSSSSRSSTSRAASTIGLDSASSISFVPLRDQVATTSSCQIHFAGHHLGSVSCHNGMPFFSAKGQQWIFSRTGEWSPIQKLSDLGTRNQLPSLVVQTLPAQDASELLKCMPDRAAVESILNHFQSSMFGLIFPIIDHVLFGYTLDMAYAPADGQETPGHISAKACVLAFMSFVGLTRTACTVDMSVSPDECATTATHLLADVFEDVSVMSLQTVFMLLLYQTFSGRLQTAMMLHAVACRKVVLLGGHNYVPRPQWGAEASHQERESYQIRMLFWLCYVLDKDIAMRSGQPPILVEDFCDLTLPERYEESQVLFPGLDDHEVLFIVDAALVPRFPGHLPLSILKEKVCRHLYSPSASQKSESELLRTVRELDDELESWRISLPIEIRPVLVVPETSNPNSSWKLPTTMRQVMTCLDYHYLMTMIHRVSGRCRTGAEEGRVSWNSGFQSSLVLSVEASRSTLFYLRGAATGLPSETYWVIIFYPMSALITLFCNILINPLDPRAKADIELLKSTSEFLQRIPIRRLTEYETTHMEMINDFVAELIRLGHYAVEKAENEVPHQFDLD